MLNTRLVNQVNRLHHSALLCRRCKDNPQPPWAIHPNNSTRRNKASSSFCSNSSNNSNHSHRARIKSGCLPHPGLTWCKHKTHHLWHTHTNPRMHPSNSNRNRLPKCIGCTSLRSQRITSTDFRITSASTACLLAPRLECRLSQATPTETRFPRISNSRDRYIALLSSPWPSTTNGRRRPRSESWQTETSAPASWSTRRCALHLVTLTADTCLRSRPRPR